MKIIWPEIGDDIYCMFDGNRLKQLLLIIVDNAVKYNNQGGEVKIDVEDCERWLNISVVDNGIGISAEHLERIFERFYRVDKGRSRETGGTGLGLAIAKHIAQSYGANITIASQIGEGTKVVLQLQK